MKIYVGFSRNRQGKIFSRLLQWYEGLPVSHTYVRFNTLRHLGSDFIYHSTLNKGVNSANHEVFLKDNEEMEVYALDVNLSQYKAIIRSLHAHNGLEYGMLQNLGILLVDSVRRLGFNIPNPWKTGMNCSELVARDLINIIYPHSVKKDYLDLIKPSEIRDILIKKGHTPEFTSIF